MKHDHHDYDVAGPVSDSTGDYVHDDSVAGGNAVQIFVVVGYSDGFI